MSAMMARAVGRQAGGPQAAGSAALPTQHQLGTESRLGSAPSELEEYFLHF